MSDRWTRGAGRSRGKSARPAAALAAGLLAMIGLAATAPPAGAEAFLDLYTGKSFTLNSDIRIKQPSQNSNFTFEDVPLDDQSFSGAPYYGVRAGYFFEKYPWLGVALEYFHFKIVAETSDTQRLTGVHLGSPVDALVHMDSVVQGFAITHGVNYLTVDALFRYPLLEDPERFPRGRVQLYSGLGVGPVITHAETTIDGAGKDGPYQVAGVGVQAFVGVRAMLFKYVGVFTEYKFTHSSLEVGVAHGGTGRVDENTHHIVGGITISFPSF